MAKSSPKTPSKTPPARRRRATRPRTPWVLIAVLFVIYLAIGLLLSVPAPPYWVWAPALVGTLMLILGLNRPMQPGKTSDRMGIFAYLGGLSLVVALSIAANYVGGGQSFDNIRFTVALVGLALLTLLAVVLTAVAAIINAQTGARLMAVMPYWQSLSALICTCLAGISVGGLIGLLTVSFVPS